MDKVSPKNSIASIKGIICIVAVVISLAGGITIWATQDGDNNALTFWSGWMFVASVVNLVAYLLNMPVAFAMTATVYFVGFAGMLETAEGFRRINRNTNRLRAVYAGIIVELIGVTLSFFGVPFKGFGWGSIFDVIALIVVAVLNIIGGALFANINAVALSAQIFIVLAIFAIAVLFNSRAMMFASLVLSTYLFMIVLPGPGFGPRSNSTQRKAVAGAAITFVGMLLTSLWCVITIHFFHNEVDKLTGETEEVANANANTHKTNNATHGSAGANA